MSRSRRRLLLLLAAVPVVVVLLALAYQVGMATLEGERRGFWDSVLWSASTLTTTGYGVDHHWRHPVMVVYVTVVQFLGLFMVYLIFPIFFIPFLEERFELRLPQEVPRELHDHAVIYRYGPAVESLIAELTAARVPTLVLEPDEVLARRLHERGIRVVHRGLADGALAAARLERSRALIVNGSDDENAAAILAARQLGFGGPLLALVEDPLHRRPMMLAGATAVFTPRHILGAALAARQARAVILALDTDSATLFATVILNDLAPGVPVIARVNEADNVDRIHRAGAFFALSISQISGQMLAKKLLGREAFEIDPRLEVLAIPTRTLAGQHPTALAGSRRAGAACSVAAVERGDDVFVDFGADFRIEAGDIAYLCGSRRALQHLADVLHLEPA